jgi:hypothetical protein
MNACMRGGMPRANHIGMAMTCADATHPDNQSRYTR